MPWSGAAGLNYGNENYFSGSEYGKGLDEAKKLEVYKKLTGNDFDPFKYESGNKNSAGMAYQNMFEPVMGGRNGREPTGERKLRVYGGPRANVADFQGKADEMRQNLLTSAYDQAIQENLFSRIAATQEDYDKHVADVGFEGTPGVDAWIKRRNNLTGEEDWVLDRDRKEESNFYRKYKDPIIIGGAGVLGAAVGGPGGAMLAASLARTARETYKARKARREVRDARRDWENEQAALAEQQPQGGNLFRSAGEGVVEYATKDIENRRRGTLVRGAR